MGVILKRESIDRVLVSANETAKSDGAELLRNPRLRDWAQAIRLVSSADFPRTYLAITAVLLVARSMYEREQLDVMAIKAGNHPRGYAASSIGSALALFAKEQHINLRANSQQPLNNQPFTFKERILENMGVQPKYELQWKSFYKVAQAINNTSSSDAKQVLALLMHMSRREESQAVSVLMSVGGREAFDKVTDTIAGFVRLHSAGGRVGKAFVAGMMDALYGPEKVFMYDSSVFDTPAPGDVRVSDTNEVWLWCEVKQTVIEPRDVEGFVRKVKAVGGERVAYFAFINSSYRGSLNTKQLADRLAVSITLHESPEAAMDYYLRVAPGSYQTLSSRLLSRIRGRMVQAHCAAATVASFDTMASAFAVIDVGEVGDSDGAVSLF